MNKEQLAMANDERPMANEAPDTRGFFRRLIDRLFPTKHCFLPVAPAHYLDVVTVRSVTHFNLRDRLRILITGCVVTESKTVTQRIVGYCATNSVCYPTLRSRERD